MAPDDDHILKKRAIIAKYNSTSLHYEKRYADIQKQKYAYFLKNGFISPKLILDAGCGTGLLLAKLLDLQYSSDQECFFYIGVDISLNMVRLANASIRKSRINGNLGLILADLENLPLRADKFDCIFSITSLQNLHDIQKGITELVRISKLGADLNISILKKQLDREKLISMLQQFCYIRQVEDQKNIEDFLIKGSVKKG